MGRLQGVGDLPGRLQGLVHRQRPLVQALGQIMARHQFHHQERPALVFLQTMDTGNVGMIQRRQHPRFTVEPFQPFPVACHALRQKLDGHLAVQAGVGGLPDHPHPPFADLALKAVLTQLRPDFDTHGFFSWRFTGSRSREGWAGP